MICQPCFLREPKVTCRTCGKEERFVTEASGICPNCVKRAIRSIEIVCARCGGTKLPAKFGGEYCKRCQVYSNRGRGLCSGCNEDKEYLLKKEKLCNRCYMIRYAPGGLQKFVEKINIPDEYNRDLFRHLVGLIDWETAGEETRRLFSQFGRFLQSYHFNGPLTWESILKLKSELVGRKFEFVRRCLHRLGELLLDPSKDETLEECQQRIKPLLPEFSLAADVMVILRKYELWLRTERKDKPPARRAHLRKVAGLWSWCTIRGLTSLAAVEALHIEEYLHTLGLKWRCRQCFSTKNSTVRGESPPSACENLECRAFNSYEKVIRCSARSVRGYGAMLNVFFRWLKDVEEGIEVNPAPVPHRRNSLKKKRQRRTRRDPVTIQYYDWEVIDALLKDIEQPGSPSEEAGSLYFLLYHGFYPNELRTVQIPLQCRPIELDVEPLKPFEEVLTLEWNARELSRGRQFVGRSGEMLQLDAKEHPWVKDLFRRLILERGQKLRDPNNPYLFVGTNRHSRGGPAGDQYFRHLIERASARVTGRICTPEILGKSSRVIYAEFGGHEGWRHLCDLGLGEQHARSYTWARRVRVIPKPARQASNERDAKRRSRLTLPPIDVFGIPTN
jgi:integrase